MEERNYQVQEAVRLIGVESHVLRYWEEELGITVGRTKQGYRLYSEENIRLFRQVKELKAQGIGLKAIRLLLGGAHDDGMTEWERLMASLMQTGAAELVREDQPDRMQEEITEACSTEKNRRCTGKEDARYDGKKSKKNMNEEAGNRWHRLGQNTGEEIGNAQQKPEENGSETCEGGSGKNKCSEERNSDETRKDTAWNRGRSKNEEERNDRTEARQEQESQEEAEDHLEYEVITNESETMAEFEKILRRIIREAVADQNEKLELAVTELIREELELQLDAILEAFGEAAAEQETKGGLWKRIWKRFGSKKRHPF